MYFWPPGTPGDVQGAARPQLRKSVYPSCGRPVIVDSACCGWRTAVRLGEDAAWLMAELESRNLPPGTPPVGPVEAHASPGEEGGDEGSAAPALD
ncbi:hypothetical protein [Streptomyces lasiicapitis]|uniref:hypothetical protein n=1 Tax=Streptomyces lasiicapitis TaxID=1923961 RepID=UPI003678C0FF